MLRIVQAVVFFFSPKLQAEWVGEHPPHLVVHLIIPIIQYQEIPPMVRKFSLFFIGFLQYEKVIPMNYFLTSAVGSFTHVEIT